MDFVLVACPPTAKVEEEIILVCWSFRAKQSVFIVQYAQCRQLLFLFLLYMWFCVLLHKIVLWCMFKTDVLFSFKCFKFASNGPTGIYQYIQTESSQVFKVARFTILVQRLYYALLLVTIVKKSPLISSSGDSSSACMFHYQILK